MTCSGLRSLCLIGRLDLCGFLVCLVRAQVGQKNCTHSSWSGENCGPSTAPVLSMTRRCCSPQCPSRWWSSLSSTAAFSSDTGRAAL